MSKLSLNPPTTFKYRVEIPVAGSRKVPLEFEFKYRDRDALREFLDKGQSDAEVVLDILTGWELDDEFNDSNVRRLCNSYPGAAYALVTAYVSQLAGR